MPRAALLACLAAVACQAFDASKFRTSCEADSSFCSTLRATTAAKSPQFEVQAGSVRLDDEGVEALLWQPELGPNSTVRLRVSVAHDGRTAGAPPWRVQVLGAAAGNTFRIAPLVMDDPPRRPVTLTSVTDGGPSDGARHVMRAGGASAADWASELALDERPFRLSLSVARGGGGGATGGGKVAPSPLPLSLHHIVSALTPFTCTPPRSRARCRLYLCTRARLALTHRWARRSCSSTGVG
jgi:hypothetical protein